MSGRTNSAPAPEPNWQALLPVARELERWVNALPALTVEARETWGEFAERQRRGEAALAARLQRMPGCTIAISPQGLKTSLVLAGVEAASFSGLAGVCREWIAQVREEAIRGRAG